MPIVPVGKRGSTCSIAIASTFGSSSTPAAIIGSRAARPFFGRLKEQHDVAVQRRAPSAQLARRTEQHRGVRVVPAGVHLPGTSLAQVSPESSSIGSASMSARSAAVRPGERAANHADDAGLRDAPVLDAELVEFALDQRRGPVFFEPQLGMAMNLTPNRNRAFGRRGGDEGSHPGTLRW